MDCYIESIRLHQYKNYKDEELEFHSKLNAILGLNGMGKTNLLDAVYYSCLGKSYFSSGDRYVKTIGSDFFRIETKFIVNGRHEKLVVKVIPGAKKQLLIDGKKIDKIGDHIGRYPVTIIAPDDIQLLLEGSEARRNFLNHNLIQYDAEYTDVLIIYNRLLKQRNALLKTFTEKQRWDQDLLDAITAGMEAPANYIYKRRLAMVDLLIPKFNEIYKTISGQREDCQIKYKSSLENEGFIKLMGSNREKDRILGRTTSGIHRDDLKFYMNEQQLKPFGSQGQLKSFVLSLKLAQYHILKDQSGKTPILLLDDVFDKLDKKRVGHLLEVLHDESYGQVFLTDKDENDIPEFLRKISDDYAIFVINEGSLKYRSKK
jgi:DNA replication and repair protein RecF